MRTEQIRRGHVRGIAAGVMLVLGGLTLQSAAHDKRPTGLYTFDGRTGDYPAGGVITNGRGVIFGTTQFGGNSSCNGGAGCGNVFGLFPPPHGSRTWTYESLYEFQGGQDGESPSAPLTLGPKGALYGYTSEGSHGKVFELLPPANGSNNWTFEIIYTFTGGADGNLGFPAPLIWHHEALYGIAFGGSNACGQYGCGSVFSLVPPQSGHGTWSETTLFNFTGGSSSGEPSSLAGFDGRKRLYVSTLLNNGAVVALKPVNGSWNETVLTTFKGGNDGADPSNLVLMSDGTLYGLANKNYIGLAFQLALQHGTWKRSNIATIKVHRYGPNSLSAGPNGSLIGTIWGDVDFFPGAVFQLSPPNGVGNWMFSELGNFNHGPDRNPNNVVVGRRGNLFGVLNGGDSGFGAVFELR